MWINLYSCDWFIGFLTVQYFIQKYCELIHKFMSQFKKPFGTYVSWFTCQVSSVTYHKHPRMVSKIFVNEPTNIWVDSRHWKTHIKGFSGVLNIFLKWN